MQHLKRARIRAALLAGTATVVAFAGLSTPVRAALIAYSDPAYGPNSAVLDTATGLEYLNLRLTQGLAPAQVVAQLGPSGTFAGFRYATAPEFYDLTASYFGTPVCCFTNLDLAKTETFADLFGPTGTSSPSFGNLPEVAGYFGLQLPDSLILVNAFFYQTGPGGLGVVGTYDQDSRDYTSDPGGAQRGSYLVRPAPTGVPEPASLALLGTGGLLSLGLARCRTPWRR